MRLAAVKAAPATMLWHLPHPISVAASPGRPRAPAQKAGPQAVLTDCACKRPPNRVLSRNL